MTGSCPPRGRRLRAEAMDGIYRWQRWIYDLTRKYYLLGRDRLIADLDAADGASVLEIGWGTGRNLVAAARRYPGRPPARLRHLGSDARRRPGGPCCAAR